jgi:hypothetical protein
MAESDAGAHSGTRQLAESNRNLLLNPPEKSDHPNDFKSLKDLERTILAFQERFLKLQQPFQWKFTRDDLRRYLAKLADLPLAA